MAFPSRASWYLAMQGPMNTALIRLPNMLFIMRAWATAGETTGASWGVSSG